MPKIKVKLTLKGLGSLNNLLLKQDLTIQDLQMIQLEMNKKQKSSGTAWLLWLFLGAVGGHRYFLGKTKSAIIMTLTLGGIGFWTLIDLFLLSGMIKETNEKIESDIIGQIKTMNKAKLNETAIS